MKLDTERENCAGQSRGENSPDKATSHKGPKKSVAMTNMGVPTLNRELQERDIPKKLAKSVSVDGFPTLCRYECIQYVRKGAITQYDSTAPNRHII